VDDFDVLAMASNPNKADSPLLVDANRVLPFAIATQSRGSVHLQQLAQSDPFECTEAPGMLVMKKRFGFLAAKAPDHTCMILRDALYVKRRISG